jgi:primosomal protein N' (replication factor Y)
VSRAREELEALARVPVTEVSGAERGRSSGKGAGLVHQELGAPVVVGTEAVLHRAGSADAVVFLDFDSELLAPRMRAAEESLALLVRASRLVAGSVAWTAPPGRARGRVLVQTRFPGHEVLAAAVSADPGRLWEVERPVRQALRLPPFGALAVLSGAGADAYGTALREAASPDVEVTGPVDGRWSVRADGHLQLCDLLAEVSRPPGRLRVEIDPVRV